MDRHDIELKLDPSTPTHDPNEKSGSTSPQPTSPARPKTPPPPPPPPRRAKQQTPQNETPREAIEATSSQGPPNTLPESRAPVATHLTTLPPSYPHASLKTHSSAFPAQRNNPLSQNPIAHEFYAPYLPRPQPQPQNNPQPPTLPQEFYAPVLHRAPPPLPPISQTRAQFPLNADAFMEEGRRRYGCRCSRWWVLGYTFAFAVVVVIIVFVVYLSVVRR